MDDYDFLLNKVVTFTSTAVDFDLPFEEGMKAKILAVVPRDENILSVVFDFKAFEEYNIDKESKLYYTEDSPKKWHQLASYPENGIFPCELSNAPDDVPFTVDEDSATSVVQSIKPVDHLITIKYLGAESTEILTVTEKSFIGNPNLIPREEGSFLHFRKDNVDYMIPLSRIILVTIQPLEIAKKHWTTRPNTK